MSDQNPVFIPGPTNIPDRLRRAMMIQTRDHRAPDFVETLRPVPGLAAFGSRFDGRYAMTDALVCTALILPRL